MDIEILEAEESKKYKRIFGGIAVPGLSAAGFSVVIGETRERGYRGQTKFVLLDEVERWDARELVECAGGFDYRYYCDAWLGDTKDFVLDKFIRGFNEELSTSKNQRHFKITYPGILLNPDGAYRHLVPELNEMLGGSTRDKDKRRLFLKENSRLMHYMQEPQVGEAATLSFGDYPAIDALCFAVFGLKDAEKRANRRPLPMQQDRSYSLGVNRNVNARRPTSQDMNYRAGVR